MKAASLMNALTDQVEKLKTHQNNHVPATKAEPKQRKVRRMVTPKDVRIDAANVVTA